MKLCDVILIWMTNISIMFMSLYVHGPVEIQSSITEILESLFQLIKGDLCDKMTPFQLLVQQSIWEAGNQSEKKRGWEYVLLVSSLWHLLDLCTAKDVYKGPPFFNFCLSYFVLWGLLLTLALMSCSCSYTKPCNFHLHPFKINNCYSNLPKAMLIWVSPQMKVPQVSERTNDTFW